MHNFSPFFAACRDHRPSRRERESRALIESAQRMLGWVA